MKTLTIAYGAALLAFLVIDGLWLGVVANSFYSDQLSGFLRDRPLALPAIVFYLFYTAGLVFLAVRPGQANVSLASVAFYGAIVGALGYGTYNMTNLATLRDWPWLVSVVDLTWGAVLSASVATVSSLAVRKYGGDY